MAIRYVQTVAVAFSWYATVAILFFLNSRAPYDDRSCSDGGGLWCSTPKDNAWLVFLAMLVFLGVSLLASLLIAVPLSRRFASALAAGTVSAVAGSTAACLVVLLWAAAG